MQYAHASVNVYIWNQRVNLQIENQIINICYLHIYVTRQGSKIILSTMRNKIYLFIVLRKYDRVLNVHVLKRNSIFL